MRPFWLNYGGGVNSAALAIMIIDGLLPEYDPCRFVFADTWTERDETYWYIANVFMPYLASRGRMLEIVQPNEGVYMRWKRLSVTGSRIIRTCTQESKIRPIEKFIKQNGGGEQLIGIDAGEPHRAVERPGKHYPLVSHGIDRAGCIKIIERAGLPLPIKSGCWCCPFMRVGEVMELARQYPEKFNKIERLEAAANKAHPGKERIERDCDDNIVSIRPPVTRTQWADKPATYWRDRATSQGELGITFDIEMPCECFDGA